MTCPSRRAARWLATPEAPVWLYLFDHLTDLGDPPSPFAFVPHASQRAYVFNDLPLFSETDKLAHGAKALAAQLGSYWTNMARLGRPELTSDATWPRYSNDSDVLAVLDVNVTTASRFRSDKCDLMDRLLLKADDDGAVTLSNIELPKDSTGRQLITGEADVLEHDGAYYFFFSEPNTAACSCAA